MDIQSYSSTISENSIIYQAIKENNLEEIKSLLDNGADVNAPIWTTGPFAGYTALHVACMENKDGLVDLLIYDYEANVDAEAQDGIQPIHLACFYEPIIFGKFTNCKKVYSLAAADANPDTEFGREIFIKHVKDKEWCPDFGEKMTLLTYTIIYKKPELAACLANISNNLKIISLKNKTLLMYAFEYDFSNVALELMDSIGKDPEYMNHRDNDGIPTIHYILYPKKYCEYRYDSMEQIGSSYNKRSIMEQIINVGGADKYALLNDDPETFLPNVAAYRSCSYLLHGLLPYYESMSFSKVLYNATLPIDDNLEKIMHFDPTDKPEDYPRFMQCIREMKQECTELALKNLIIRQTFGLPNNKEEVQLMNDLISADENIKNIVDNFERNFINGELKSTFIKVNEKKISLFDFFMQVYDEKKLKILVKDETIYKWHDVVRSEMDIMSDYHFFHEPIYCRIEKGRKRFELLNKLTRISTLRKAIDLPYELVLDIIEYLNNAELNVFIDAFFIC